MSAAFDTRGVIRCEDVDRVRWLTLDRPDALNAMNDEVYDAVRDALQNAADDPELAVVVVTGAGRAFSAGQDLAELATPRHYDDGRRHGFAAFIEVVEAFPKPLIAAVNGIGVGIGLTFLPHCDLVLISETARLRAPFVSLGVTVEAGNSHLLPATIGWQQAAHLLYTADWLTAEQAVECGLAWRAVAPEALMEQTREVASQIARMPIASLVGTKRLLLDARLASVRAAREREAHVFGSLVGGPANREAIAAFRERRAPDFSRLDP